jgi:hypothetical protein
MLETMVGHEQFSILGHKTIFLLINFERQAKRKQALLESNLPGISCPTGMVK